MLGMLGLGLTEMTKITLVRSPLEHVEEDALWAAFSHRQAVSDDPNAFVRNEASFFHFIF